MSNNTAQIDVERKEESVGINIIFSILLSYFGGERCMCGYITYINLLKNCYIKQGMK